MPEKSGIFYTDQGKGFPVVLIHGFCETHEIWSEFSKELSKDFRILCIDLPGFGKSPILDSPFSLLDVGASVLAWLRAMEIESCITIGHSLGGYIALAMAEQDPERFKAFGLFHSTAFADSEERKFSRNKVIDFVTNHGVKPYIESFIPPLFNDQSNPHIQPLVELGSQTDQTTLIAYVSAMRDRPDRTEVLQQFKGSILFLAGEKDLGIPPESVMKQAVMARKPDLQVLLTVNHMGMFEDQKFSVEKTHQFLVREMEDKPIN